MSGKVLEGWRTVELADIAKLSMGETLLSKNLTGDGIPVFSANTDDRPWGFTSNNRRRLQRGDIVVGARGSIGFPRRPDFDVFTCTQTTIAVEPDREVVDSEYLHHALCGTDILGIASQQAVPMLTIGSLSPLEVLLPPFGEQRRIAEVLRSVDEAIAANEAVAVQARRTYQAALTELVGSGLDHWETVCLGQIATFVNGRGFKPHEWDDEGLPIIRIQNLNGGNDFNYYCGNFNPKILVRPGDLLFAWSGSRGTSFGPHIWRGPEGVLNYHTWKVVPAAPEDRDYLYFALRHLTKKIEDEAHGASALVHMQKAYVVDYEIQLPPPEEREAIAATLMDLQAAVNHADQVFREERAMKGHLMSDLLSGRVPVPA